MPSDEIRKTFENEFILGDWDLKLGGYQGRFLEKCVDITEDLIQASMILQDAKENYPTKKAKEIALDAAAKMCSSSVPGMYVGPESFIQYCDHIYNWLVKEDNNGK